MTHWSDRYVDIPHSQLDCGELVELVLREQYGRDVHFPHRLCDNLTHRSALILNHVPDFARHIDKPVDGCGVLMFARGRRAHIGIYLVIDGQEFILHSDEGHGSSIRSRRAWLPRWYRIEGFYAWL